MNYVMVNVYLSKAGKQEKKKEKHVLNLLADVTSLLLLPWNPPKMQPAGYDIVVTYSYGGKQNKK